jgi:Uma2 family endonuclease
MAIILTDPRLERQLKAEREASGADRYDEVWEGITMMAPLPNNEHQEIATRLACILQEIVGWPGLGDVCAGVNLSDRAEGWEHNYRVPDVAVFLRTGRAENLGTHWRGAADFLVEVISPCDRTREKLDFYSRLGVRELLLVDREPWALELYRDGPSGLEKVESADLQAGEVRSAVLPLIFRLVSARGRPDIEVGHAESGRTWRV